MYHQRVKRKILNLNLLKDDEETIRIREKKRSRTDFKDKKKKSANKGKPKSDNKEKPKPRPATTVDGDNEIELKLEVEDTKDGEDIERDDPFLIHTKPELSPALLTALEATPKPLIRTRTKLPTLGCIQFSKVEVPEDDASQQGLVGDPVVYAAPRDLPTYSESDFNMKNLHVKPHIVSYAEKAGKIENIEKMTDLQKELFTLANSYHNVYYPQQTFENSDEIRLTYCTHLINHVVKSKLHIYYHNSQLTSKDDVPEDFRDQGVMRPKVLILLPFRSSAFKVIKMLINIQLGKGGSVFHKNRFTEEYSGDTIMMPEQNPKPPDYQELFSGNADDNFRIGIGVQKKCLKLYTDFYASDIIVASPLGLRMLIGAEGEEGRDYDFLASIEILVMDQSHVFVMQNWEHVLHIMSHLHLHPKDSHGSNLSRVRLWALNGWSKYYMQSLVFSFHPIPEITALFNSKFLNYAGSAIIANPVTAGSICQVVPRVPQVFHRIESNSVSEAIDDRFEAFFSTVMSQYKDTSKRHVLIYVPSYFDFVRLRNQFKTQERRFVHICEYTDEKKIIRARSKFYHGSTQFLLYTERFHFYRRVKLRGIKHLIFYQPPTIPSFYSEMCNFLQDVKRGPSEEGYSEMTVDVLYTKFDITKVASIVGTERATKMLASEKKVHMFMTDST